MQQDREILSHYLREQIALEERIYSTIQEQLLEIDEVEYADARELLTGACEALAKQYAPLNSLLDLLEEEEDREISASKAKHNGATSSVQLAKSGLAGRISEMLRDDYSALNHITISDTRLHTLGLALGHEALANMSLQNLASIAPFIVRIGELMPEVITRELKKANATIREHAAKIALENTKSAWHQV